MKSSIWRMRQIPEIHLWPIKWIKRKVENFLLSNNMGERAQQFLNKFQKPGHPQRGRANSFAGISTFKKKKVKLCCARGKSFLPRKSFQRWSSRKWKTFVRNIFLIAWEPTLPLGICMIIILRILFFARWWWRWWWRWGRGGGRGLGGNSDTMGWDKGSAPGVNSKFNSTRR